MSGDFRRYSFDREETLTDDLATTPEIFFEWVASGMIFIPASGTDVAAITWYAAREKGGTYLPANEADGTAITQTVAAGKAYELPPALFGARYVKAVAGSGTGGVVGLSLKS